MNTSQQITVYIQQNCSDIILDEKKTQILSSKVRNQTRLLTLFALAKYSALILSQSNKTSKIKMIQVGKKENYSNFFR